jgi:hypothetical protein
MLAKIRTPEGDRQRKAIDVPTSAIRGRAIGIAEFAAFFERK